MCCRFLFDIPSILFSILAPLLSALRACVIVISLLSQAGAVAVPAGPSEGLDAGDIVLLRFNQPVRSVPASTKAAVDALLTFQPSNWAVSYTGSWVDDSTLAIQVQT